MTTKTKAPQFDAAQFKAYEQFLSKLVSPEWCKDHANMVKSWWIAGIAGGMFRAGVEYGRRSMKP